MDVLIFDDDPVFSEMVAELVQAAGYSVEKIYDTFSAIPKITAAKPQLLIMDIMMPGVDGLTLCRRIKSDPQFSSIPVIAISAKAFPQDRAEALRCGADLFISKPCDIHELTLAIVSRLKKPESGLKKEKPPGFYARILGCRGPSAGTAGPPTSSLIIALGGRFIVLDAGSGLESLGHALLDRCDELLVLLTHYHEDHVCGLPGLRHAAGRVKKIRICGPTDTRVPLNEVLRSRLQGIALPSACETSMLGESGFAPCPDVRVNCIFTRHPGSTLAYRISYKGHGLVYCPDNSIDSSQPPGEYHAKLVRFVQGADVLIHDARYSDGDIGRGLEPGHSCPQQALSLALEAGVRELVLFHLDASYNDETLGNIAMSAQLKVRERHSSLRVGMAYPGAVLGI